MRTATLSTVGIWTICVTAFAAADRAAERPAAEPRTGAAAADQQRMQGRWTRN